MPRKQFLADLEEAAKISFPNITSVARGEGDDVIAIFVPPKGSPIEIVMMPEDLGGYPSSCGFMIYAESADVSKSASSVLERVSETSKTVGMTLSGLLTTLSSQLRTALAIGASDNPVILDDDSDIDMIETPEAGEQDDDSEDEDEEDDYDYGDSYDSDLGFDTFETSTAKRFSSATLKLSPEVTRRFNKRIRGDLRAARMSHFNVGVLGGMKADSVSCLLSLSVRIRHLGLSEEVLQAWDLQQDQYFVLLIRYSSGYKDFEAVISEPAKSLDIDFRVGVCKKYKPTLEEALAAFTEVSPKHSSGDNQHIDGATDNTKDTGYGNLFISSSLNEFINTQFVSLLKIRKSNMIGWDGAKRYFNDRNGRWNDLKDDIPDSYFQESASNDSFLADPKLLVDHMTDPKVEVVSFPLVAAQFALQRLLRCTDYCLVCYDHIEEAFGALKPYVCSKPLCLYQYMSLGFGPSVEHEILTQPYVVDLLVSFCYCSAFNRKLREYPTGMSLSVPPNVTSVTAPLANLYSRVVNPAAATPPPNPAPSITDIKFDMVNMELLFDEGPDACPLRNGDWVVLTGPSPLYQNHRVEDISLFPTVKLAPGVIRDRYEPPLDLPQSVPGTPATTPPSTTSCLLPAKMVVYKENFDDMDEVQKSETIVMLIETLPPILELRSYLLKQSKRSNPNLKAWKDRVSPAALGILRWIIASNRSCIVQVDKVPGQDETDEILSRVRLDQKLSNVTESWVQFRFAQGSPDKEQRFQNALEAEEASIGTNHPTIFAFHGSPIPNWHSIIRSGLDYKETLHGRAFGHGIYHAMDQATSMGYAQHSAQIWKGSALKVTSAMSVNEIVNCPDKFQSKAPYLVVQHIDWVQCRYLLVSSSCAYGGGPGGAISHTPAPSGEVKQDPKYTPTTGSGQKLGIPMCAVSATQSFIAKSKLISPQNKKRKESSFSTIDGALSDGENPSDLEFMISDDETMPLGVGKEKSKDLSVTPAAGYRPTSLFQKLNVFRKSSAKSSSKSLTDFIPGSLDQSTLPMLEPPSYATPGATKSLQRALREILDVQKKTPLHELGWYIDPELISNVFQWIVELHSFEPSLPIAADMKAAGVTSVVLEIRFGKDYPFSPPFVRVIRPRFLPFMSGGGGHVTGGGAMCMELLTNSGWSSVSTIESVLLQVRMAIMNTEPKPARLERTKGTQLDYGTGEAIAAYIRACQTHGWAIPPGFNDFATNGTAGPIGGMY